jgi:F0F1-type ATP synthase assembly protein I
MGLAGAGFEIAAAVGGFAALGWWYDREQGTSPRGLLIGATLGLVGGLYNLIRSALRAGRAARAEDAERRRVTERRAESREREGGE